MKEQSIETEEIKKNPNERNKVRDLFAQLTHAYTLKYREHDKK